MVATGPQILRCRTCEAVCQCIKEMSKEMSSSRARPGAWKLIRFPSMKSPRTAILSTFPACRAIPIRRPEIFLRRAVALSSISGTFFDPDHAPAGNSGECWRRPTALQPSALSGVEFLYSLGRDLPIAELQRGHQSAFCRWNSDGRASASPPVDGAWQWPVAADQPKSDAVRSDWDDLRRRRPIHFPAPGFARPHSNQPGSGAGLVALCHRQSCRFRERGARRSPASTARPFAPGEQRCCLFGQPHRW